MRIVSLLPSATEIAFALGLGDQIVGVTHECDYPPEALSKPRVTYTTLDRDATSAEIDAATTGHLEAGSTSYGLDEALLVELQPDLVLTQMLCEVCAVPHSLVQGALPAFLRRPKVLSLEPTSFGDVLSNIKTVGDHTDRVDDARRLITELRTRVDQVALSASRRPTRSVVCLEWLDPPWSSGHWVPDMIGLAGGIELIGGSRQPSRRMAWERLADAQPELIILAICGFDLERTMRELERMQWPDMWPSLAAVQADNVYAVDGSAYFTRPGPRLVDGIEILADIFSRRPKSDRFRRIRNG